MSKPIVIILCPKCNKPMIFDKCLGDVDFWVCDECKTFFPAIKGTEKEWIRKGYTGRRV